MTTFQHRYVAFAKSQGRTPEAQFRLDRKGTHMLEFSLWIREQWRKWSTEEREPPEWPNGNYSDRQHKAFDAWLKEHYQ